METSSKPLVDKREEKLQNNVGFFFIVVLFFTLLGFYPSYFSYFPMFEGLSWVYHFHAFFATLWIVMLIMQAFLIRRKNYILHRRIGRTSYFVIPFLLFSFFLVAKAMYHKNIEINHLTEVDALASLSRTGLPDILYFGILYSLGMIYKRRTSWHIRFLTCTGLVTLGPGLGRFLFNHFRPEVAGATLGVLFLLTPIIWLVIDLIKRKSPVPLLVFLAISLTAGYMSGAGHSAWWQNFARWFANSFF